MPEGGERRRNLTTTGLSEKTRPRVKRDRGATQSPLRIRSSVLIQVEALVKDVVANHNDNEGCRSEAPPGDYTTKFKEQSSMLLISNIYK